MDFAVHVDPQMFNPGQNLQSSTSTDTGPERVYKTDSKRRARNVESSRKYRRRRREHLQCLEQTNKKLQVQIEESEKQVSQLNYALQLFIQHAEHCERCANVRV